MAVKAYALTTPERLAAFLNIDLPTGVQLTVMESMINFVTDFIEKQTHTRFKKTTYNSEVYDTDRSQTINLKHFPILSSDPIILERRNSTLNEGDWEVVDGQYYFVDYEAGIIRAAGGQYFSPTLGGYRVTYTSGYDFDNTATFLGDTEAGEVEYAAWMLLQNLWNNKGTSNNVKSESIGDYSVTYFANVQSTLFNDENLMAILGNYGGDDALGVVSPSQS